MKTFLKPLIYLDIKGIYCLSGNFWVDPYKPVKKALITHSHFDHIALGCDEYICSYETGRLLNQRIGPYINIKTYHYEEIFYINGIKVSFHPSGHILGSSQIRIEAGQETWLVTGDFKRQKDKTCVNYRKVKTDYLISESTFALPIFNWEPTRKIINQITHWTLESEDTTSILFCYSLGKAQRILSELNNRKIKNIFTHKSINKMTDIYRSLGIDIFETQTFDKNINFEKYDNSLILLPPSLNNKKFLKRFKKVQTSFASGWMSIRALKKRSGYDKGFVISDHADWNGLIKTIKDSQAKQVYLHHGDGENLKKYLSDTENINISSLAKLV